jgi:hypothetical protein
VFSEHFSQPTAIASVYYEAIKGVGGKFKRGKKYMRVTGSLPPKLRLLKLLEAVWRKVTII